MRLFGISRGDAVRRAHRDHARARRAQAPARVLRLRNLSDAASNDVCDRHSAAVLCAPLSRKSVKGEVSLLGISRGDAVRRAHRDHARARRAQAPSRVLRLRNLSDAASTTTSVIGIRRRCCVLRCRARAPWARWVSSGSVAATPSDAPVEMMFGPPRSNVSGSPSRPLGSRFFARASAAQSLRRGVERRLRSVFGGGAIQELRCRARAPGAR